ncbi:DNA-directed DNA polymerase gamma mip1 [Tulasnella sp. 418]|nr:DNA-directed DNA polymerase gamma mip1 [Tulasnella sp. 418]
MATAVSPTNWYSWISPWLLGHSDSPSHLIPIGDPTVPRVIVGHNVSYDRLRVKEEYSLQRTANRWIDTMALHVAVKGISSHQRPAWMNHKKAKIKAKERSLQSVEAVLDFMKETEVEEQSEHDSAKREQLRRMKSDMEESLPLLLQSSEEEGLEGSGRRWEDITSANALADVARLHCGIEMDKDPRNDFLSSKPFEIMSELEVYLDYCATDVETTYKVLCAVLPVFMDGCPSPVSLAGLLIMGNGFLPVNETWEEYIKNAENKCREVEQTIGQRLAGLAQDALKMMDAPEVWKQDAWLSQLDWSPKSPGKSRGFELPQKQRRVRKEQLPCAELADSQESLPRWYAQFIASDCLSKRHLQELAPLLLRLSWRSNPILYLSEHGFVYQDLHSSQGNSTPSGTSTPGNSAVDSTGIGFTYSPLSLTRKVRTLIGKFGHKALKDGVLTSQDPSDSDIVAALCDGRVTEDVRQRLRHIASHILEKGRDESDPWVSQLDWTSTSGHSALFSNTRNRQVVSGSNSPPSIPIWPKWYWELTKPKKGMAPGSLDLSLRNQIAPILLRLRWREFPLFRSREFGWTYRVPPNYSGPFRTTQLPLTFVHEADSSLAADVQDGYVFYKVPHKDGDGANVGSPLGKTFLKYFTSGILTSPGNDAKEALNMSAQCSYWISARDRIMSQMVVWDGQDGQDGIQLGMPHTAANQGRKWGIILPQVIAMGTVTRRAIEKTWLTASNAKGDRIGSELKAMVRAPPGYAIVGADVDSEELWISSVMGDAQFGLHGATALGWMTLEGTKSAGTDLHSKTASILGITRDQAKVFNYSRIYGAGMKHAMLLLLQSQPNLSIMEAQTLAQSLYASTKGRNTHRKDLFGRKFWYGGTESFVFNKLEEIATSDQPQTPALGCGVTNALSKKYLPDHFGSDYMPSRINWVVQSSGVDYLHLLLVSMEHLILKYNLRARYLLSVHDEVRYLVEEKDKYRCALALQIANLWTRSQFAFRLGMDDLPQGVAFFSGVDIDHVLRKEADMPCVTPSQPHPIPPGQTLDIYRILDMTDGGALHEGKSPMPSETAKADSGGHTPYTKPDCLKHRATGANFLRAQATSELSEIQMLAGSLEESSTPRATTRRVEPTCTPQNIPASSVIPGSSGTSNGEEIWDAVLESERSF